MCVCVCVCVCVYYIDKKRLYILVAHPRDACEYIIIL